MSKENGQSNVNFNRVPIQIPNDARYIDPVIDYIRDVIKPERIVRVDSHWDYYLGEVVEFTKDGVEMAYDWNESWGHELTTTTSSEQQIKLVRETAERIAEHVKSSL
ncbi:hypothetical protein [Paenibacillus xylaniclasticus]|uniref:hypothetical protein n=1 Tax=Paenibacillus xylaniclasticus TaxID=588083 RepID=UPI000FDA3073|nr:MULTISPECIES: hypothetical protein [Paenibacillus]GFN34044.1 hypothetical protein PCURB6_43040 [Paenibacillus curdlanolyticus]